ncbi:MAG: DUF1631 family protein [Gammaproteobacteria bacterium]|nr:DUF1631 family protein [Gammaproteobacteria bacterium]
MTDQQRQYDRKPLQIEVHVQNTTKQRCLMQMVDFSQSGIFLGCIGKRVDALADACSCPIVFKLGQILRIEFAISRLGKTQQFMQFIEVARITADGVGGRFFNHAVAILNAYHQEHAAQYPSQPSAAEEVLHECRFIAMAQLEKLLPHLFKQINQRLFETQQLHTDAQRGAVMNAMTMLSKVKDSLIARYLEAVAEMFDNPAARRKIIHSIKSGIAPQQGLSLVAHHDDDHRVLLAAVIKALDAHLFVHLVPLERRFAHLQNHDKEGESNPMSLMLLAYHFSDLLRQQQFNEAVNRAIYSTFQEVMGERLVGIYSALNQTLISHGVLPQIDVRTVEEQLLDSFRSSLIHHRGRTADAEEAAPVASDVVAEKPSAHAAVPAAPDPAYLNEIELLLGELTQLQNSYREKTPPPLVELLQSESIVALPLSQRVRRELLFCSYLASGLLTALPVALQEICAGLALPLLKYLISDRLVSQGSSQTNFTKLHRLTQQLQQPGVATEQVAAFVQKVNATYRLRSQSFDNVLATFLASLADASASGDAVV